VIGLLLATDGVDKANPPNGEFLSPMGDEPRTALNPILAFAQLLEMEDLDPGQDESVAPILKGGRHLLELINEVLDIARIDAGHLSLSAEPVEAAEIVLQSADLIRPLAEARGLSVRVDTV